MTFRPIHIVALVSSIVAACYVTACSQDSPVIPAGQEVIVSGVVWQHAADGLKRYGSAPVSRWVQIRRENITEGYRTDPVQADGEGRYSFTVPDGALLRVRVEAPTPTYQPCVTQVTVSGNTVLDVHVISDPAQLGAQLPAELLAKTPTLSGTVFENTAQGSQPLSGATVLLDMAAGNGDNSAMTLTDSAGRYVLCGLEGFTSTYVYASKAGFKPGDVGIVALTGNTVRDIELRR